MALPIIALPSRFKGKASKSIYSTQLRIQVPPLGGAILCPKPITMVYREKQQVEPAAFWSAIYKTYQLRLYYFFRKRVGIDVVAEDLTQDLFYKLLKMDFNYIAEEVKDFESFIFRLAINLYIDYLRKAKFRKTLPLLEELDTLEILLYPERAIEAKLDWKTLKKTLKEQEWACIDFHLQGYTYKEIALKMNRTEAAVRNLISKVKGKLKSKARDELKLVRGKVKIS